MFEGVLLCVGCKVKCGLYMLHILCSNIAPPVPA